MIRKRTSKQAVSRPLKAVTTQTNGFYGYAFVLLVDPATGRSTQIGGAGQVPAGLYQRHPLHVAALQETLKRGIYHYEWTDSRGKQPLLYQTTCISLSPAEGTAQGVLSCSRDITANLPAEFASESVLSDDITPRSFAQILLAARESEKREISKALHDEIGSSAVMLTALLSLVRAGVKQGNTRQALRDLEQLSSQIQQSIERIKNVVVSLRPPSLENKGGLGGAVRDLLENISSLSHIPYTFDYDELDVRNCLSDNVKILLYRIVQEALTNIVKHAHAKHIRVSLKQSDMNIRLILADDGIGFETNRQRSIEHIGLLAMKDSVKLLGGTISIKSAPGKGTSIEVTCPCATYGG